MALAVNQPASSVNQSGLIDFSGAFTTFLGQSADMASCANTVVLTDANGTALKFPLSGNTTAYVTLTPAT